MVLPSDSKDANCDYKKAPFFNVLAAYWIQFMTHDWFSHLEEGHNQAEYMKVGCETKLVNNVEVPLTPEDIEKLGCRPDDRMDKGYVAQDSAPDTFTSGGQTYLVRAPKTMAQHQHRLVGCFATLRFRRHFAPAREARSSRPGKAASGSRAWPNGPGLFADIWSERSNQS